MGDSVNHPSHYNQYQGLEVWDLVELMSFNLGNAIKYIARAGHKDPSKEAEDLKKAIAYIEREMARLFRTMSLRETYGALPDTLASQLSYYRGFAIQYIAEGTNEYLSMAVDSLNEELKSIAMKG